MFVDERIYTLHAGQVPMLLKLYEEEAMECQVEILGHGRSTNNQAQKAPFPTLLTR